MWNSKRENCERCFFFFVKIIANGSGMRENIEDKNSLRNIFLNSFNEFNVQYAHYWSCTFLKGVLSNLAMWTLRVQFILYWSWSPFDWDGRGVRLIADLISEKMNTKKQVLWNLFFQEAEISHHIKFATDSLEIQDSVKNKKIWRCRTFRGRLIVCKKKLSRVQLLWYIECSSDSSHVSTPHNTQCVLFAEQPHPMYAIVELLLAIVVTISSVELQQSVYPT